MTMKQTLALVLLEWRTNEEWLEDACSYFGLDKNEFI